MAANHEEQETTYSELKVKSDNTTQAVFETVARLPPLTVGPDEHSLQHTYCYWYSDSRAKDGWDRLRLVGRFASVEQFWRVYTLLSPDALHHCDLQIFRHDICPLWEKNVEGGQWRIRLRKGLASRCWENLLLAILGEQFMVGDEITGAVLKIRPYEDLLSIWNKSASDLAVVNRIRMRFRQILYLPSSVFIEYKSLKEVAFSWKLEALSKGSKSNVQRDK